MAAALAGCAIAAVLAGCGSAGPAGLSASDGGTIRRQLGAVQAAVGRGDRSAALNALARVNASVDAHSGQLTQAQRVALQTGISRLRRRILTDLPAPAATTTSSAPPASSAPPTSTATTTLTPSATTPTATTSATAPSAPPAKPHGHGPHGAGPPGKVGKPAHGPHGPHVPPGHARGHHEGH